MMKEPLDKGSTFLLDTFQSEAISGLCHAKTGLKIFNVVIAKEDMAGTSQAKPSLGMKPTTEYNL